MAYLFFLLGFSHDLCIIWSFSFLWLWSVPYDQPDFAFFLPPFTAGSIPESIGNLGNLEILRLDDNKLEGRFFLHFWDGQSRTTNLVFTVFWPLLLQGASLGLWGISRI